jgi:hypothetical protein
MRVEVKPHNGTPTLFLDGRPAYANFNLLSPFDGEYRAPSQPIAKKFGQLGIHLYSIDACGPEWPGPRPHDPSLFDFSTVGPRLQAVLDVNPDAHFLLRMGFEARYLLDNWWAKAYPDELEIIGYETEDADDIARIRMNPEGRRATQSYASSEWRRQVKDLLRGYIAHLREIGLYDRVIAYQICCGSAGEWVKGDSDMLGYTGDYSLGMRRHFQNWLREKYNDEPTLRKAWNDETLTFDSADVPSPKAQFACLHGNFRDPSREQNVIDYYICLSELTSGALLDFCSTVKDATKNEKLTGAFFGYIMDQAWNCNFFGYEHQGIEYSTLQRCGHLGLHRLLKSPLIDFLVSPYAYAFRGLGGNGQSMQPSESMRMHNKLYLFEEDTLMHNRFEPDGRMHDIAHTPAIYKRNFAYCMTHGQGITWLQSSMFQEYPQIESEADALHVHMRKIGDWALQLDRTPQSEVAVCIDDESYFYTSNRNAASLPGVFYGKSIDLPRFGAPHDLYLLNDVIEGNAPACKLYVFLNAWRLNDERRRKLKAVLAKNHATAVWLYAAGYLNETPALDHMTDLTGITFDMTDHPWAMQMHVLDFDHPITRDLPQDLFWGTHSPLAPVFHAKDAQARMLGQVVTALGRCKPGFVIKEMSDWTSIWLAAPHLPAPVLRGITRHAGVHLYSDAGDVLHATPELLSVHTTGGGPRTFTLPGQVEAVYDLFECKEIARNVSAFNVTLPKASSLLFYTGSRDKLAGLLATISTTQRI